jgi:hypothetical protein
VLVIMKGELRADKKLAELRSSNAAVIAIDGKAEGVGDFLRALDGVTGVEPAEGDADGAYRRWRVTGADRAELCPMLFEALRKKDWRIGELRPDPKTLERVFRDLADRGAEVQP